MITYYQRLLLSYSTIPFKTLTHFNTTINYTNLNSPSLSLSINRRFRNPLSQLSTSSGLFNRKLLSISRRYSTVVVKNMEEADVKTQVDTVQSVIIIGSGPAAYTAALYSARARLSTLILQGDTDRIGGQLITTTTVENFPSYPEGILGFDLMQRMEKQAVENGARLVPQKVLEVNQAEILPGITGFLVRTEEAIYKAQTVIVASGAYAKRDNIPGTRDNELWNKGVSACATCDGALFKRSERIVVIGGGDTAMEEALFLTRFAQEVAIVHRRAELRASKIMVHRAQTHPKIKFYLHQVVDEVIGKEKVEKVILRNTLDGRRTELSSRAVFFAIGHVPNSDFIKHLVKTDSSGYVIPVHGTTNETGVPGLYVAGDVADKEFRQAITAAGEGCKAALLATRYLEAQTTVLSNL